MWLRTKIMITVTIALILIGVFLALLFTVILKDKKRDSVVKSKGVGFCVLNDGKNTVVDCPNNI